MSEESGNIDGNRQMLQDGFTGLENAYDPPKEGTKEALEGFNSEGFIVKIMSSRPAHVIRKWLEKYEMSHLVEEISNHKFPATVYIDDRGFLFKNWKQCLEEIKNHPKIKK